MAGEKVAGNERCRQKVALSSRNGMVGPVKSGRYLPYVFTVVLASGISCGVSGFLYTMRRMNLFRCRQEISTHHPLPHVLMLGGIILAVNKLVGSYNAGIAIYTLIQMLLMAGVFTYVVSYMKRIGIKRWLRGISLLYFGLFP